MTAPPSPSPPEKEQPASTEPAPEAVWTFRGYRLRASEFNTAMVHFFRAEVARANTWRQRLDATTNWAVVTTGAVLSFAFTQTHTTHYVIALNALLVTMFLIIEARRYRYYELWSYRVRLMETDFFAAMLVPPFHPSPDWAETLSEILLHPHFPISVWEALGRRLRRNYLYIYTVIGVAWMAKLWLQPVPITTFKELVHRAAIGPIAGEWVLLSALIGAILIVLLSLLTVGMQEAAGEVLPRFGTELTAGVLEKAKGRAWFRPSRRRPQLLTFIITDQAERVAKRILQDMRRGVTALSGTGMYSGRTHEVLMCALTATEIPHLKALVAEIDPSAFVIVAPAREVFGKGFVPLQDEPT